jgi:hypothetical protein
LNDAVVGDDVTKRRKEENIALGWRLVEEAKEDARLGRVPQQRVLPKFEDDVPAGVDCSLNLDKERREVVVTFGCPYEGLGSAPSHTNEVRISMEAWLKIVRQKWPGEKISEEDEKALLSGDVRRVMNRFRARMSSERPWHPYGQIEVQAEDCRIIFQPIRCLFCGHLLSAWTRIPDWIYKEMPPLGI